MPSPPAGLDPDLLRSFVLVAEGGSFTGAGRRLGLTQSAISRQLRRLEELLGQPLLTRIRDEVAPTPHGLWLLARARPLLAMQDEILDAFRAPPAGGRVRLGMAEDYALAWLPRVLADFAGRSPHVAVEVVALPARTLAPRLTAGDLDLAILCGEEGGTLPMPRLLRQDRLVWIGSRRHDVALRRPLPLALAQPSCRWRQAAVVALDTACLPWRLAGTALSQAGCLAYVQAGLALTVGVASPLPAGLRVVDATEGLPRLGWFDLVLAGRAETEAARLLARHLEEAVRFEPGASSDGEA
ncbi:MAG: LysR family transcriptional regulator [Acetobacteraceae bacterium]|nr:LysR family transcriptional regulator [Acetobacteraceae bacterium]